MLFFQQVGLFSNWLDLWVMKNIFFLISSNQLEKILKETSEGGESLNKFSRG